MSGVLQLLVTHQGPEEAGRMVRHWEAFAPPEALLVVHGGREDDFARVAHPQKLFVSDPRLRTRDHQRERQSVAALFTAVAAWLRDRPEFSRIHLAEFDHLPLVPDLHARLVARMEEERADVLGHFVVRIDGTSHPHCLGHAADPRFYAYWEAISRRRDPRTVLSMFGSGSFWKREAWLAVAALEPPLPIYYELLLPTAAHHLGFRVRDFADQNASVFSLPRPDLTAEAARLRGSWTVHPLKTAWTGVGATAL